MAAEVSTCPFCNIAASNPPAPFSDLDSGSSLSESASEGTAHPILSTEHVLAFLDIMPLTNGHVLVAPRRHYEKLGDMGVAAGQEVCSPILDLSVYLQTISFTPYTLDVGLCILDGQ
jgi:diadenosine tetraphosphate (Ap4A) HIT family hydrolase